MRFIFSKKLYVTEEVRQMYSRGEAHSLYVAAVTTTLFESQTQVPRNAQEKEHFQDHS